MPLRLAVPLCLAVGSAPLGCRGTSPPGTMERGPPPEALEQGAPIRATPAEHLGLPEARALEQGARRRAPGPEHETEERGGYRPAVAGAGLGRGIEGSEGVEGLLAHIEADVDRVVKRALRRGQMPGCVVRLGRSDRLLFQKAYGSRSTLPQRTPMTEDTIFDLASLTKPVATAASLMILADRGLVSLDDRLVEYVPEFGLGPKRSIRLRHLLLHSSGLPAVTPRSDFEKGRQHAIERIAAAKIVYLPGKAYVYSDLGYILLGEVVARVSGQSLAEFARANIFDPLEMRETFFRVPESLKRRAAPTEQRDDVWIQGVVHDPRAFRLGGVAGNAGLFSTAHDLSRFARMMLRAGELDGRRVLSVRRVETMTTPHFIGGLGGAVRALGWDVRSDRSSNRGQLLAPRAFGHGGFTGTALWIDPELDLYVLFLSNRVHPDGQGSVNRLAGAIADIAVAALGRAEPPSACSHPPYAVDTGVDVLRANDFALLRGKRVGLIANATSRARDGTPTAVLLRAARHVHLKALFSPEHGLSSDREGRIAGGKDPGTGLPVHSLFGPTRRPNAEMLKGIDSLVFDLQDVGTRFFTYMSTLRQVMQAAAEHGIWVVVLDRPNPINGFHVEGPIGDREVETFVNYHPLPVRHGMTAGELAQLINAERGIGAELHVVRMKGWRRGDYFEQTGLRWVNPSPNIRSPAGALLYPAVGLLESTNLSVGRGTDSPFEVLGAPWLASLELVAALRGADLPGLMFMAVEFTPRSGPYRGQLCHGVRMVVTDRQTFRPVRTGLEIARQMLRLHRQHWKVWELQRLLASRAVMQALLAGRNTAALQRLWEGELQRFLNRRRMFLLYDHCPS